MKRFFSLLVLTLVLASLTGASSCLFGPTETSTTDAAGQPTLVDGDFPDESPCSDRDTLPNDFGFLGVVADATHVIHIHKAYTDDDHLPAVCGLGAQDNSLEVTETGWDPAEGNEVNACYALGENLSSFFVEGSGEPDGTNNPGMCRSNFGFTSANTADGFPRAGTYRVEACVPGSEASYQFLSRVIVTGEDVNKTLTAAGIEGISSLEVFDAVEAEATTTARAKEVFQENPYNFTFTLRSGEGVNTHMNVTVQVICVKKVSACPAPNPACS